MKKNSRFIWLLGFLGFMGFGYFYDGDPSSLFYFSFFGYFSFYFIGKIAGDMADERYMDNSRKALVKTSGLPIVSIFIIGFIAGFPLITKDIIVAMASITFATTHIVYSMLFWHYDSH